MANILTGDFDVVAEFALPAINRVLAAMHQCQRMPHSVSLLVNDNPPPWHRFPIPVVTSFTDGFGDPVVNQQQIAGFVGVAAPASAASIVRGGGGIVNPIGGGLINPPVIEPSHIQGRAQLQLFPPTIDVPDATGTNLSVTMNLMARYFPDANTAPLAEFIRGNLTVTAPVNQISSLVGNVIQFDFNADTAQVNFAPTYSNAALSADDLAGIDLLVQNALRTSVLPSSANLPSGISALQFKALQGPPKALAVLLNLSQHSSSWSSVSNVFLNAGDDFAFAVGSDFIIASLQSLANSILSQDLSSSGIKLKNASFDLQTGKIVVTINGHADTSVGGTDFTATLDFSLRTVGPSVYLVPGGVSLGNLSNPIVNIINWITGDGTSEVTKARNQALTASGAYATVTNMFNVNSSLGSFLNTLLNPDFGNGPPPGQSIFLTYTGVDIQPAGIIARGSLWLLFVWPAPYVEFEQIPSAAPSRPPIGGVVGTLGSGPDYSAFKSWIPGGTIDQYVWSTSVNNQLYPFGVDPDKFVLLSSGTTLTEEQDIAVTRPPGETGGSLPPYQPLCLTVQGTRLSSQGAVVSQFVTGNVCGYTTTPVLPPPGLNVQSGRLTNAPVLAMTRRGPQGQVVVTGYASAQAGGPGAANPNLIVHFGDSQSAAELNVITRALQKSKRPHSPALVLAALPSAQLSKASFTNGVIYADDRNGAWASQFGLQNPHRPLTILVDPKGKVTWKHEGALHEETLVATLSKHLVDVHNVPVYMAGVNVRISHPAPNFLFEYTPGREMTLSKVKGSAVVLVFWRSSIEPSIQAVLDLQKAATSNGQVVLAVNDGESPEVARAAAAASGFTATVVTDPEREIALAYGVDLWPTIVAVDATGNVAGVKYGHHAGEHAESVAQTTTAGQ